MITGSNTLLVLGATYISNPLTLIPIYIFSLNLGSLITGSSFSISKISYLLSNPSFNNILFFFSNNIFPVLIGSFLIGLTLALVSYFTVYFSVNAIRVARAK